MANNELFEEVYSQFGSLVYNFVLNYVQNSHDAEDITQEVFIKVFRKIHQYDPAASSMKTWICRITINHCIDFIRARKTKRRFGAILGIVGIEKSRTGDHPGIAAEDREEINYLFRLINMLPPNQKTAILLIRIEGRSQKETAEIMNISVKALESLLQRAKQTLSKKWAGEKDYFKNIVYIKDMDDKLDKLKRIGKVEPPPFLFTRIQEMMHVQETVPGLWKWSFPVAAMVLIVFNVAVMVKTKHTQSEKGVNEMVSALHLSASNSLYNE